MQQGWLKYPQYTKPEEYKGYRVPEILLSGHHEQIALWRKEQAVQRTAEKRPDLLKDLTLTQKELKILKKINQTAK